MKLRHSVGLLGVVATTALAACGDDGGTTTADAGGTGGSDASATTGDASTTTGDASTTTGDASTSETIVDVAADNPDFSILVDALVRAELDDDLAGAGPFTVFAPTNDAFTALLGELGASSLDDIDTDTLTTVLLNHVVAANVPSTAIPSDPPVATNLAGLSLWFNTDSGVMVNEATVTSADITADNGVIHVVDDVINPASLLDMAGFAGLTELATAIGAAADIATDVSVADALAGDGPFTVFAPTNEAFQAITAAPAPDALRDILLYHVSDAGMVASTDLEDGANVVPTLSDPDYTDTDATEADKMTLLAVKSADGVMVNGANVVIADIMTTNAVIHVVDSVIMRPDVVEMAGYAGLSQLAGALTSADLVTTLQGEGPFTVFAPVDAAFEALDAVPTGSALSNVLLYHVATPADVMSSELMAGAITMANGDDVTIDLSSGVMVDGAMSDANVAVADVVVTNGVVHVVDTVLLP